MTATVKTIGDVKTLLNAELDQLEKLNQQLYDKDKIKFSKLTRECSKCQKSHDLYEKLLSLNEEYPLEDDFEIGNIESVRNSFKCECGNFIEAQPDARRSFAEIGEQRRELFDVCLGKISSETELKENQSILLARYIFRSYIYQIRKG